MQHPRFPRVSSLLLLGLLLGPSAACTSPRGGGGGGGGAGIRSMGDAGTDPSCWEPSSIVPDITCGTARPDVVCPGSCGQTLDGIVGVGLSACRCMDTGSGFGGQWVCDTSMCDGAPPATDGGGHTASDGGVARADAGGRCDPVMFAPPTEPGCTAAQRYEIMRITSQADYDAFVANPANDACNTCMSQSALACATSYGCDDEAGALLCCLDAACGDDDACRDAAFGGACVRQTSTLQSCVSSIAFCALDPTQPPADCFP